MSNEERVLLAVSTIKLGLLMLGPLTEVEPVAGHVREIVRATSDLDEERRYGQIPGRARCP